MNRLIATVEALRVAEENAAHAPQRAAETEAAVQAAERDVVDAAKAFVDNVNTAGREEHHGQHVPVPEATAPTDDSSETDAAAATHDGSEIESAAPDTEPHIADHDQVADAGEDNETNAAALNAEQHIADHEQDTDGSEDSDSDGDAPDVEQRIADHEGTAPPLQDVRAFLRDGHWFIHLGPNRGLPERDAPVHSGRRGGRYYNTRGGHRTYVH